MNSFWKKSFEEIFSFINLLKFNIIQKMAANCLSFYIKCLKIYTKQIRSRENTMLSCSVLWSSLKYHQWICIESVTRNATGSKYKNTMVKHTAFGQIRKITSDNIFYGFYLRIVFTYNLWEFLKNKQFEIYWYSF